MTATVRHHAVPEPVAVPLCRLTLVELRKLADTRAGLWLLIVIGAGRGRHRGGHLGWAPDDEQTFAAFFAFGLRPPAVLLPVLGILLDDQRVVAAHRAHHLRAGARARPGDRREGGRGRLTALAATRGDRFFSRRRQPARHRARWRRRLVEAARSGRRC